MQAFQESEACIRNINNFIVRFSEIAPAGTRKILKTLHRKELKLNREKFFVFRKNEGIEAELITRQSGFKHCLVKTWVSFFFGRLIKLSRSM